MTFSTGISAFSRKTGVSMMTQSRRLYDGENRLSDYAFDLGHREQYRDEKRSIIMFKQGGTYLVMAWDFARGERRVHSHGDLASARECFDGFVGPEGGPV